MSNPVSVKLPSETGAQLRALGDALNRPLTDVVANLLILGAEHHRVPLPIDGVEIDAKADGLHLVIDEFAFRPMTPEQTVSFATTITAVVDRYEQMLDLDVPDLIDVSRVGSGIAITVMRDRVQVCRRTFSRGVARLLVHALTTAAAKAAIDGS